jgi:exodeoxyribonuclease VII large subunit
VAAPGQIVAAIEQCNQMATPPDVLVVTRGGGSAEDLAAFSTEQVTRAVAASRIPTLVAIGHEVDISLSELAADQRASTPSNAAELLVPDRRAMLATVMHKRAALAERARQTIQDAHQTRIQREHALYDSVIRVLSFTKQQLASNRQLLMAYDPQTALARGYALVQVDGRLVRSGAGLSAGGDLEISLQDATVTATVKHVSMNKDNHYA